MASSCGAGCSPAAPEGASCWICLEEDDSIKRSCACRGVAAGFAHVGCLAKYAQTKMEEIYEEGADDDKANCTLYWRVCPNCNQKYTGDVRMELADIFSQHTSDLLRNDGRRLEARLYQADELLYANEDADTTIQAYRKLLSDINTWFPQYPETTPMALQGVWHTYVEVLCLYGLSAVYKSIGDSKNHETYAKTLMAKAVGIKDDISKYKSPLRSDFIIALSQTTLESIDTLDAASQRLVTKSFSEVRMGYYGKNSEYSVMLDQIVARSHDANGDASQAAKMAELALSKATTVFGPEHEKTKSIKKETMEYRGNCLRSEAKAAIEKGKAFYAKLLHVAQNSCLDTDTVLVLRPAKNSEKYICIVGRAGGDQKVKISANHLFFETGTPCVVKTICRGTMGGLVQCFDRKSKRYVVLSDIEEGEGRKVACLIEGSQASVKPDFTRSSKDAQTACKFNAHFLKAPALQNSRT